MNLRAGLLVSMLVAILLVVLWPTWPGSTATYVIFTIVYAALLIVGITQTMSTGYILFAIVLWIGYWLKLSLHLGEEVVTWIEPIGRFSSTVSAWDDVAIVSSVGALGVLCVGFLWRDRVETSPVSIDVSWYTPRVRIISWAIVLLIVGFVVVGNEMFNIFHAGLRPNLDLPWPLQGLFGWLVSVGIVLSLMVLFHLDVTAGRPLWMATALFFMVSVALSISTFSRGTFVLQALPFMTTLILLRNRIPWLTGRRLLLIAVMFACGTLFTVGGSQHRRASTLPAYTTLVAIPTVSISNTSTPATPNIIAYKVVHYSLMQDFYYLLRRLTIDRWIGLEGVMAVSSYPGKSIELLIRAAKERRDKDHVDFYTGEVSRSGSYDTSLYHFATPPGIFAFLYYSGSLLVVLLGAALMTAIVFFIECMLRRRTQNPFLAGQVGFYSIILAIQMGAGGLVQPVSALIFTVVVALVIGVFTLRLSLRKHKGGSV